MFDNKPKHSPRLHNLYPFIDEMKTPHTHTKSVKQKSTEPNRKRNAKRMRKAFLSTRCVYLRCGNLCNKISVLIPKVERVAKSANRDIETRQKHCCLILVCAEYQTLAITTVLLFVLDLFVCLFSLCPILFVE